MLFSMSRIQKLIAMDKTDDINSLQEQTYDTIKLLITKMSLDQFSLTEA